MNRRSFSRGILRAVLVAIGLPVLEAMLITTANRWLMVPISRQDLASGFGNGVRPTRNCGPYIHRIELDSNTETAPLLEHKSYLFVVSGCNIKTSTHPHHSGMTGILRDRTITNWEMFEIPLQRLLQVNLSIKSPLIILLGAHVFAALRLALPSFMEQMKEVHFNIFRIMVQTISIPVHTIQRCCIIDCLA